MSAKAKYYVTWKGTVVCNEYELEQDALRNAEIDSASARHVRVSHQGKTIARWKDGKRVKR